MGAAPDLAKALKDTDVDVRSQVAQTLGRIGPEAEVAVPALQKALADSNESVRIDAALALWQIARAREAIPALLAVELE
jgi:HEAT repeat protein